MGIDEFGEITFWVARILGSIILVLSVNLNVNPTHWTTMFGLGFIDLIGTLLISWAIFDIFKFFGIRR